MKPINKLKKYAEERIIAITKPYAYTTGQQEGRVYEIIKFLDKCIEVLNGK